MISLYKYHQKSITLKIIFNLFHKMNLTLQRLKGLSLAFLVFYLFQNCTAPRSIIESGRVTPKKHIRAGVGTTTNIPTAFTSELIKTLQDGIGTTTKDTFLIDQNINNITGSIVSYSLDPLTQTFDFYFRYGMFNNFDMGYKYTGGVHVLDAQYQIAGDEDHNHLNWGKGINSSFGLQYSGQKYELPSILEDIQDILGYEMARKDLFLKFIMSKSFGEKEKIGHFGFGLAYNHTFINYGLSPGKLIVYVAEKNGVEVKEKLSSVPEGKNNYGSYGGFINFRVGYKNIFFYSALSVFWQNYGSYQLFEDYSYESSGLTFIPTLGIQLDL